MRFYENYLALCEKVGKSPSRVALEIPLSKPTVTRWSNGGGITDATARKVANYFGVTVEELMGKGIKKERPAEGGTLSGEDKEAAELREIWNSADENERRDLLEMARMLKNRRKQNG